MENPTRHFQMMLRRIAMMAKRFDGSPESVNIIHSVVANFDSSILRQFLPNRFSRVVHTMFSSVVPTTTNKESSGIQYADIYKDEFCHVNAFGFAHAGLKIPLHDHPGEHAVMKVFQGAVRIRSFTILEETFDEEYWEQEDGRPRLLVRYEGETVLSGGGSEGRHSAALGPNIGNIHEVVSLEPHTYFCDFFFPPAASCNYYRPPPPSESLHVGQTLRLQQIRSPADFFCDIMEFPQFQKFNLPGE